MTIEELHDHLFDVLCVIDDICKKENVRWFLEGGTELGAVREGDFIAWDDDVDIKVLLEDYASFKAAMQKHLPPYMKLMEPADIAPRFYDFVIRICDTRYPLRHENAEDAFYDNFANYVGTDVFIYSDAPKSSFSRKLKIFYNKILYGFAMAHRYKLDYRKYSTLQKIQVFLLTGVGHLIPLKTILNKQWKNTAKNYGGGSGYLFASNYNMTIICYFPKECMEGTVYFPIRGRQFPVSGGYDLRLRTYYGDYMTPERDPSKYIQHPFD